MDYQSSVIDSNTIPDVWINFTPANLIVAPPGTASVRFQITYHNTGAGGSVYVDNANLRVRSPLAIPTVSGTDFQISFPTVAGPTYQVLYKNSLSDPSWSVLRTVVGDGQTHVVSDPAGSSGRFYTVNTQ
ncbi:MAG: hypothetical protein WDM76_08780 [Limisphaerales bacterium]